MLDRERIPAKVIVRRSSMKTKRWSPGFYSVALPDRAVKVELTTTERVGLHRYTFQNPGDAHILIDLAHACDDYQGIPTYDAVLEVADGSTVVGGRAVHDVGRRSPHLFRGTVFEAV